MNGKEHIHRRAFFFLFFHLKNVVKIKEIQVSLKKKRLVWRTRPKLLHLRWLCSVQRPEEREQIWCVRQREGQAASGTDVSLSLMGYCRVRAQPPRARPVSNAALQTHCQSEQARSSAHSHSLSPSNTSTPGKRVFLQLSLQLTALLWSPWRCRVLSFVFVWWETATAQDLSYRRIQSCIALTQSAQWLCTALQASRQEMGMMSTTALLTVKR